MKNKETTHCQGEKFQQNNIICYLKFDMYYCRDNTFKNLFSVQI